MSGASGGRTQVTRLALRDFRNMELVTFDPAPRFNLIFGHNGHGKTSLIEALYVVSTTKSFRAARLGEVIRQEQPRAEVRAEVESFGLRRELRASISPRGRSFLIDGKKPKRFVDYALKTPVIAFHPGELSLASGSSGGRRILLDRILLHQDPAGSTARLTYQTALRDRQRLLLEKGPSARELDVYEQVVATEGARFAQGRAHAAQAVIEALVPAFARMAPAGLACEATYQPGGSEDPNVFVRELLDRRQRDAHRGVATFGPHRDELHLVIDGKPARSHASQGQQRLLALALKLSELACVREVTGMEPMLLLDDVSSELDPHRTHAVFELLGESKSQIFVTTTRPELFNQVRLDGSLRADFEVLEGVLSKSEN